MGFKERLKEKRIEANLTQVELAERISVSARTIQNYEIGSSKPTRIEVVEKLAEALGTPVDFLLGQGEILTLMAHEKGGAKAARDIESLVSEVTGLFAGGELTEESMDAAMQALNRAYWIAKDKNKKYASKKRTD